MLLIQLPAGADSIFKLREHNCHHRTESTVIRITIHETLRKLLAESEKDFCKIS